MKRYVVTDATGMIVRTIICPESMKDLQAQPGDTVFESDDATASTHYEVGGKLVPLPPGPPKELVSPINSPPLVP